MTTVTSGSILHPAGLVGRQGSVTESLPWGTCPRDAHPPHLQTLTAGVTLAQAAASCLDGRAPAGTAGHIARTAPLLRTGPTGDRALCPVSPWRPALLTGHCRHRAVIVQPDPSPQWTGTGQGPIAPSAGKWQADPMALGTQWPSPHSAPGVQRLATKSRGNGVKEGKKRAPLRIGLRDSLVTGTVVCTQSPMLNDTYSSVHNHKHTDNHMGMQACMTYSHVHICTGTHPGILECMDTLTFTRSLTLVCTAVQ